MDALRLAKPQHPQSNIILQNGVSLFDLLIAISIFLLITCIAVPSFSHILKKNQKNATVHSIKQLLTFARQQAVDRGENVVVCSSEDESHCSRDWQYPFIVFVDSNKNNRLDEEETLLRTREAINDLQSLSWRSSGSSAFVHFDETGGTGYQNGRIYYCDLHSDSNQYRAQIIIYRTGRVRMSPQSELRDRC